MKRITAYQTDDGQVFTDKSAAERREARLLLREALHDALRKADVEGDAAQIADALVEAGGWRVVNALSSCLRRLGMKETAT